MKRDKSKIIVRAYLKLLIVLNSIALVGAIFLLCFSDDDRDLFIIALVIVTLSAIIFPIWIILLNCTRLKTWFIFDNEGVYAARKQVKINYSDIVVAEYIAPTFKSVIKAYFPFSFAPLRSHIPGVLKIKGQYSIPIELPISKRKLHKVIELSGMKPDFVKKLSF